MRVLNEQERQILILHAVTGLKHREIAEMMGMPLATVLSKYARSLKKLKSTAGTAAIRWQGGVGG